MCPFLSAQYKYMWLVTDNHTDTESHHRNSCWTTLLSFLLTEDFPQECLQNYTWSSGTMKMNSLTLSCDENPAAFCVSSLAATSFLTIAIFYTILGLQGAQVFHL